MARLTKVTPMRESAKSDHLRGDGARQSTECDGSGAFHDSVVKKLGEIACDFIFSNQRILDSAVPA
jgi:hypothetical protein